jgi:hypothetical protein
MTQGIQVQSHRPSTVRPLVPSPDVETAAFHQAGHLALCVYYGIRVREIREPGTPPEDLVLESSMPDTSAAAESWFKMYIAGGIAEERYCAETGRPAPDTAFGSEEDRLRIRKMCLRYHPAATTSMAVMQRLLEKSARSARIHFADPRMWAAVRALADRLQRLDHAVRGEEKDVLLDLVRDHLRG